MNVDLSDFNRIAGEYRQRAENLRSRPLGDQSGQIAGAVKEAFLGVLMDNEHVSLPEQQRYYRESNSGYYGSGSRGNDPAKINPQEFIAPGAKPILGSGRFYGNSGVNIYGNGVGADIDLYSTAIMQPYPYNPKFDVKRKGRDTGGMRLSLPPKPVAEYMREGWIDPMNSNHFMKPRPFGKRLAESTAANSTVGRFIGKIIASVGFRHR